VVVRDNDESLCAFRRRAHRPASPK
jgi:hypothetical protein